MKKIALLLLLIVPTIGKAQNPNDIVDRITMIQFIVDNPNGQLVYRQTKNWCVDFLSFTDNQQDVMDKLFNAQYIDIAVAYKAYAEDHSPVALASLIDVTVKQEFYFRRLLTPTQLDNYRAKFIEASEAPDDAKNKALLALFFSDEVLTQYSTKE
ncbi:MAG: hypothetical protein CFE23_13300 [Flavobacterium sp. BFFFF1]|uniref:hypothetical protein n=1 Tax=Flavobacterium sp. BFFFF1 TaxID=2015557 RepID=UPI000BC9DD39|nr:hypothetical protein [Flavobacterium sp. BFFFF1]OYU79561.1 MAG: hypothetical protein CFE23_13300 [Flavobacterium sp. BFFFF1]